MGKSKAKLTAIPKYKARRPTAKQKASGEKIIADAVPDLSHISQNLRSLAFPAQQLDFMVGNPLDHPEEQIEELKASLRQFGFVEPLVVNKRPCPPVVIGGNGRLKAALSLDYSHVPVNFVDMSEEEAGLLAIVLNRSGDGAEWNKDAVDKILRNVQTPEPDIAGMLDDLAKQLKLVPPDETPGAPKATIFQVVIECVSESQQEEAFEHVRKQGWDAKKLTC